jgi:hypothetical protein
MYGVQGTPVNINGRTGGAPGPATTTATRIDVPMPPGRAKPINGVNLTNRSTTFARQLTIRNFDGANTLRVRFYDDTYVTVPTNGEKTFMGPIPFFSVQASAATVEWDATAIVAS